MSWRLLDPRIRHIAETELTPKQFEAYRLKEGGANEYEIAAYLGISRRSVRDRLFAAGMKINRHLEEAA